MERKVQVGDTVLYLADTRQGRIPYRARVLLVYIDKPDHVDLQIINPTTVPYVNPGVWHNVPFSHKHGWTWEE